MKDYLDRFAQRLFSQVEPERAALCRILMGLNIFLTYFVMLIGFEQKFPLLNSPFVSDPMALFYTYMLVCFLSLLLVLGLLVQPVLLGLIYVTGACVSGGTEFMGGSDIVVGAVLFIMLFMRSGEVWSLDRLIFNRPRRPVYFFPFLSLFIVVSCVYFIANVNRIDSRFWNEGIMVLGVLKNDLYSRFPEFPWESYAPFLVLASHVARVGEILGIFMPFAGRFRKWLSLMLISLHLGILLLTNIASWQCFMLSVHMTALPVDWYRRILSWFNISLSDFKPVASELSVIKKRVLAGVFVFYWALAILNTWPSQWVSEGYRHFRNSIPPVYTWVMLREEAFVLFKDFPRFVLKSCIFGIAYSENDQQLMGRNWNNRCAFPDRKITRDYVHEAVFNSIDRGWPRYSNLKARLARFFCSLSDLKEPIVYGVMFREWSDKITSDGAVNYERSAVPMLHYNCQTKEHLSFDQGFAEKLKAADQGVYQSLKSQGYFKVDLKKGD